MAIQVNIEKNFKGFSLKSVFESNTQQLESSVHLEVERV